jgi:hypothetical protein
MYQLYQQQLQQQRESETLADWGCVDPGQKNGDKKQKPRQQHNNKKKKKKKKK